MAELGRVTPVLRMFDEDKAREFYVGFLGFAVMWEHRFGENFPLAMGVERDGAALILSEHHGDGSPGANVRISTTDIDSLEREFTSKTYRFAKPGVQTMPWGAREMTVADPFGNRLTFSETEMPVRIDHPPVTH